MQPKLFSDFPALFLPLAMGWVSSLAGIIFAAVGLRSGPSFTVNTVLIFSPVAIIMGGTCSIAMISLARRLLACEDRVRQLEERLQSQPVDTP